jgi:hypothetical protein
MSSTRTRPDSCRVNMSNCKLGLGHLCRLYSSLRAADLKPLQSPLRSPRVQDGSQHIPWSMVMGQIQANAGQEHMAHHASLRVMGTP